MGSSLIDTYRRYRRRSISWNEVWVLRRNVGRPGLCAVLVQVVLRRRSTCHESEVVILVLAVRRRRRSIYCGFGVVNLA